MAILPGYDAYKETYQWTPTEAWTYLCLHMVLIALFAGLFVLLAVNIWQLIIKQQKYRNAVLLVFYIFSSITIVLKEILNVCIFVDHPYINAFATLQPIGKLHVGLIQCWIIFELTLHIRHDIIRERDPTATVFWTTKVTFWVKSLVLGFLSLSFTCLSAYALCKAAQGQLYTFDDGHLYLEVLGYFFLLLFVLMLSLNIALFCQIRTKNKMAGAMVSDAFKREKRQLKIVLTCFELSYGIRFFWDVFLQPWIWGDATGDEFALRICYDFVSIFDGVSFLALIFLHNKNSRMRHQTSESMTERRNSSFPLYQSTFHESILMLNSLHDGTTTGGSILSSVRKTTEKSSSASLMGRNNPRNISMRSVQIMSNASGDYNGTDEADGAFTTRGENSQQSLIQAPSMPSDRTLLDTNDKNLQLLSSSEHRTTTRNLTEKGHDSER